MKNRYEINTSKPLTVHDIPHEERPRERLKELGAENLSSHELIALILGSGMPGESVLSLSQRLISHFGSFKNVFNASMEELLDIDGIGQAKASQLIACFEIAKRVVKETLKEEKEKKESKSIISPEEAVDIIRSRISDYNKEQFLVVSFDTRQKVIGIDNISTGTLTASIVHPRETFERAIKRHAASILAAHNHPSGDPEPSEEDIRITKRLTEAGKIIGIELLDHIIITRSSFYSFKEKGMI
ncbi:MAG: JAB domain-containing protein [Ignavibacteriae bacterium]|nr:MAG: JAB domain-containing protein [Ignavibacteriota bacterium]